jgi:hypothetical protein
VSVLQQLAQAIEPTIQIFAADYDGAQERHAYRPSAKPVSGRQVACGATR